VVGQDRASSLSRTRFAAPRRPARSQPADWLVHFPGPDRCGENRIGARPGGLSLDDETHVVRIDMSSTWKSTASRACWGTSRLCRLRRRGPAHRGGAPAPYSVVLFDEIEKAMAMCSTCSCNCSTTGASPTVKCTVDFRNTVIIMTSNVGSKRLMSDPPDTEVSWMICAAPSGRIPQPRRRHRALRSAQADRSGPHRGAAIERFRAPARARYRDRTGPAARSFLADKGSTRCTARARSSAPSPRTWKIRWPRLIAGEFAPATPCGHARQRRTRLQSQPTVLHPL